MFEPAPAGISGGAWSDRHGIVGRHPTLGPSGGHLDPGDITADRTVTEHDPQIPSIWRGGAEVQSSRAAQQAGWFYQRNVLVGRSACHVVSATGTGSSVMLVISGGATVVGLCLVAAS